MTDLVTLRIGSVLLPRWQSDEVFRRRVLVHAAHGHPHGTIVQVIGHGTLEHYRHGKSGLRKIAG